MRLRDARNLALGLLGLAVYWYVGTRGFVLEEPPVARTAASSGTGTSTRSHPTFWSTGYQGGK